MSGTFACRDGVPLAQATELVVGGLQTYVYGLDGLDPAERVVLLALAHPRMRSHQYCAVLASEVVHHVPNVVCATFDKPNHGSRVVRKSSNMDWAEGNALHGVDLLATIHAGAAELELILRFLPSYVPALGAAAENGKLLLAAAGASLGGHACWKLAVGPLGPLGSDVLAGIVPIVSSPYIPEMLADRARDQGVAEPFPHALAPQLREWRRTDELRQFPAFAILAQCGEEDTLVPPKYTQRWGRGAPAAQKPIVYPQVGHWCSSEMIDAILEWLRALR